MLRVDCYDFYKLAFHVHPLTTFADDSPFSNLWPSLFIAKREMLSFFNMFPLKTTQPPAQALYDQLLTLVPDDISNLRLTESDGSPRVLVWSEMNALRTLAVELEAVLKAELSGWDTFFVSQKGGYSTADLINHAEKIVPERAQPFLTPQALEDVQNCGRCIAFNLGTAAAFHIVRAAESFIIRYYEHVIGTKPLVKARNWGAYIRNLEKCGRADAKVLGWMTQIKDEYRNPVLHPEETLSPSDALEFMHACMSLMATISRALVSAGVTP